MVGKEDRRPETGDVPKASLWEESGDACLPAGREDVTAAPGLDT
jgi:hypothetical protein